MKEQNFNNVNTITMLMQIQQEIESLREEQKISNLLNIANNKLLDNELREKALKLALLKLDLEKEKIIKKR